MGRPDLDAQGALDREVVGGDAFECRVVEGQHLLVVVEAVALGGGQLLAVHELREEGVDLADHRIDDVLLPVEEGVDEDLAVAPPRQLVRAGQHPIDGGSQFLEPAADRDRVGPRARRRLDDDGQSMATHPVDDRGAVARQEVIGRRQTRAPQRSDHLELVAPGQRQVGAVAPG